MKHFKLMMLGLALSAGFTTQMQAQEAQSFVHQQSNTEDYVWPTDPQVLTKLKHWQDQKFGVLMHWGLYSVPGIENPGQFVRKTGLYVSANQPTRRTRHGTGARKIPSTQ